MKIDEKMMMKIVEENVVLDIEKKEGYQRDKKQ